MPARSVMTTDLVTLRPDDTIDVAARTMLERDHGELPVVDDDMRILGVLTDTQVIRLLLPSYVDHFVGVGFLPDKFEPFETSLQTVGEILVRDIMCTEFATAPESTTLPELANRLLSPGVRHIMIVRDDRLVGVVCRRAIIGRISVTEGAP